jgi:Ion channel
MSVRGGWQPRPGMASEDPQPDSRAPAGGGTRARFGLLLLALAAAFFTLGIAPEGDVGRAVVTVLAGSTLLLAFWVAEMPARRLRVAAIAVGLVVAGTLVVIAAGSGNSGIGANAVLNGLLVALAPPAVGLGIARNLRAYGAVTIHTVYGALCLYLLAGLFFAFVYNAIHNLGGDPFFANGAEATPARLVYFSFTTLTTLGYGDFSARTDLGHTLSATEALIGQIYLVTVVSVIVANLAPRRRLRGG